MPHIHLLRSSLLAVTTLLAAGPASNAADMDPDQIMREIEAMKARIAQLEAQLSEARSARQQAEQTRQEAAAAKHEATEARKALAAAGEGLKVGGAVRFQYSNERYNEGNRERGGDLDFDIFRLNLDGTVRDVTLSAEWRWFQYMNAVHHAWVGYDFNGQNQVQLGIQKVPFGVLPYDSHSYFFSSNYYVGLEDDYDAGLKYLYQRGPWDLRLAFYLNDEQGGVDGFVDNRSDRYSYDVVGYRGPGEGTYDQPANPLAENNTWNARLAYTFDLNGELDVEAGVSGRYGQLNDGSDDVGDQSAYAVHLVGSYRRWNLQLQAASYEYDVDAGAELMAVGAYSFFDTIAAEADIYTANIAYTQPVSWGPISSLTFYNDYSVVSNKSANLDDTWMNVTGVGVAAGKLYTYIDYVTAENQPFIGGSMGANGGKTDHRLNINFGYYF